MNETGEARRQEYSRLHLSRSQQEALVITAMLGANGVSNCVGFAGLIKVLKLKVQQNTLHPFHC